MSRMFRKSRLPTEDGEAPKFSKFKGIVNTHSRKDIGMGALVTGNNVLVTDTEKLMRVPGHSVALAGDIHGVYGREDRLYVVKDDELLYMPYGEVDAAVSVVDGLAAKPFSWEEVNGDVFYANGIDAGIVRGAQHLPWRVAAPSITSVEVVATASPPAAHLNLGATYNSVTWRVLATYSTLDGRESAPSEVVEFQASPHVSILRITVPPGYAATNIYCTVPDGESSDFRKLISTTHPVVTVSPANRSSRWLGRFTYPLPGGVDRMAFFGGAMYAAMYMPAQDQSVIWCSEPFAFHLWRVADKGLLVKGQVSLLLAVEKGLLVGSTEEIRFYDGERFDQVVDYGVVPGEAGDTTAEGVAFFWTARGFCKAMPFENITEAKVSMPPGSAAYSKLLYLDGMMHFVAVTDGSGKAFNQRKERT